MDVDIDVDVEVDVDIDSYVGVVLKGSQSQLRYCFMV